MLGSRRLRTERQNGLKRMKGVEFHRIFLNREPKFTRYSLMCLTFRLAYIK